jgi:hypothetical protein
MWNFTVDGFTSVVEYDPPATHWKDGKHVPFDDGIINNLPADYSPADKENLSSHVLVRARIKEDLDALKTYDPDAIETEDKTADYQYRLVMRRTAYATYMYDKVMTLDYKSHVKETIDRRAPKVAGGRYQALSAIWRACVEWQPNAPWSNQVNYGGYGPGNGKTSSLANGKPHATSYWDKSLGRWVTPGGSNPKALPAGASAARDERSQGANWPSVQELDAVLADTAQDAQSPEPPLEFLDLGETREGLRVTADATRSTMIAQVKDLVKAMGRSCEVEALVDDLQEAFGTVDVDTIPHDTLMDMTESFESVSVILAGM